MKNKLRNIVSDQIWPHINPIWDHVCDCVDVVYNIQDGISKTASNEIWDAVKGPFQGHVDVIRDCLGKVPISLI